MKKYFLFLIIIILISFTFVLIKKNSSQDFSPKIAVTIFPFYDIVKEIVGNKYEIVLIAPPGTEPHNFEPSPSDIKRIFGVKIIFTSGTNLDEWVKNLSKNFSEIKYVNLNKNIELINNDPHYWLSIENMKKVAQIVNQELQEFDPINKNFYETNYLKLNEKLNELLNFARKETAQLKSRNIITQHNAFIYLAKELNLNIIGFFESENKEMTPLELKKIIDVIEKNNIKIIFKEPGEENNVLNTLAKELNLQVYSLDPIEGKNSLDYFSIYAKNIKILKEALNQ